MSGDSDFLNRAVSSEFGTYRLCEQRRFRRACAPAQSRQNLRCSLIQAVSQEEPSGRKPDPWPRWMAGHAQLKFVMTECSKTQICLTGLVCYWNCKLITCIFSCYYRSLASKTVCLNHFFFFFFFFLHKFTFSITMFIHNLMCIMDKICLKRQSAIHHGVW